MAGIARRVLSSRLFWTGLLVKAALIVSLMPTTHATWFAPFFHHFWTSPGIDPWTAFLASGGNQGAFPYGPAMFVSLLPTTLVAAGIDAVFGVGLDGYSVAIGVLLLAVDVAALFLLLSLRRKNEPTVIVFFWAMPLVAFISYVHGQLDIIPVTLMLAAFVALARHRAALAGALLGVAIGAKLSMVMALPFAVIYLIQNRRLHALVLPFVKFVVVVSVALVLVPALSPGYRAMVFGTAEAQKVFSLFLPINADAGVGIYLLPMIYLGMLYATWRLRRSNIDVLVSMTGVSFLLFVILSPASPGWYLWLVPFVVIYSADVDAIGRVLVATLTVVATLFLLLTGSLGDIRFDPGSDLAAMVPMLDTHHLSLLSTVMVVVGLVLAFRMFNQGIIDSDFYQISRQRLVIGIAGDSGTGKDTLASALTRLFGRASVTDVSGDDYHRWERGAPMWRSLTHLNPVANDLYRLTGDVRDLKGGKSIRTQTYDHSTGMFSPQRTKRSREVILVSGLHTFLSGPLTDLCDVRIFLNTDPALRRRWKKRRDVAERGHTEAAVNETMERREVDGREFVDNQKDAADIVFQLAPTVVAHVDSRDLDQPIPLKLTAILRETMYVERFRRALVALCGAQLDIAIQDNGRTAILEVSGDIWADDIALAAKSMMPRIEDYLALEPEWEPDMLGVIQLIVLAQVSEVLANRRLP